MALEVSIAELLAGLEEMREALELLRVTLVEDKPLKADLAMADGLSDITDDLRGSLEEALAAVRGAREAVRNGFDVAAAYRELARCQTQVNHIGRRAVDDLLCYEQIAELERLVVMRTGGAELPGWAKLVREAIQRCRQPLHNMNERLSACWLELAERSSGGHGCVKTANIGQKITAVREMAG